MISKCHHCNISWESDNENELYNFYKLHQADPNHKKLTREYITKIIGEDNPIVKEFMDKGIL